MGPKSFPYSGRRSVGRAPIRWSEYLVKVAGTAGTVCLTNLGEGLYLVVDVFRLIYFMMMMIMMRTGHNSFELEKYSKQKKLMRSYRGGTY